MKNTKKITKLQKISFTKKYKKIIYSLVFLIAGGIFGNLDSLLHRKEKDPYFSDIIITDDLREYICHNSYGLSLSNIHIKKEKGQAMISTTVTNYSDCPIFHFSLNYEFVNGKKIHSNSNSLFIPPHSSETVLFTDLDYSDIDTTSIKVCVDSVMRLCDYYNIYNISEIEERMNENPVVYDAYLRWFTNLSKEEQQKFSKFTPSEILKITNLQKEE